MDQPRTSRQGPSPMQGSDHERFAALYDEHLGPVLAYARRRTTSPEDAEEVAAETFLVAWRRLEQVPDDALPWLYGVAAHTLLNLRRGQRRRAELVRALEDEGLRVGELAAQLPHTVAQDARLTRALATLDADEREALLLVAWEGLTAARAAVAAGVSRATLTRRVARARKALRAALAAAEHPAGTTAPIEEAP